MENHPVFVESCGGDQPRLVQQGRWQGGGEAARGWACGNVPARPCWASHA